MNSAIRSPKTIDRFINLVTGFLENMPDRTTCEAHILAGFMGFSIPACDNRPVVGEIETEFDLCRECFALYQRGEWSVR